LDLGTVEPSYTVGTFESARWIAICLLLGGFEIGSAMQNGRAEPVRKVELSGIGKGRHHQPPARVAVLSTHMLWGTGAVTAAC
jgi:hypothetical protein